MELLERLGDGATLGDQVEAVPNYETKMKFPKADDPTGSEMRSSQAINSSRSEMRSLGDDDPAISNPKTDKPDADTLGAANQHILKRDWFLLCFVRQCLAFSS